MNRRTLCLLALGAVLALVTIPATTVSAAPANSAHLMRPLTAANVPAAGGNLFYHGGVAGIGVETSPAVYVIFWGWTSDPSHVAPYLGHFLQGVGGSGWANSTTQYCQSVPTGTIDCSTQSGAVYAGNPAGVFKGYWVDNTNPVPSHANGTQLAAEADRAAVHFGNLTAGSNLTTQYVIATPHNKSSLGFGIIYCAYHNYTSTSHGNIAFTNLPYMPDAGTSCGKNFVNAGSAGLLDGVSIVEGHEYAETVTDQFPSGGWNDSGGAENGDKCAWISSGQGASQNITLTTGTFAVQSLWSNSFNGGAGGCVV